MVFDFACPDWAERLAEGLTPIADLPLDEDAGEAAVRIFDNLRLPDVPGQPRMGVATAEWVRDIVRAVFGSVDAAGRRQVGEVFCLVPKKNAKTTSGAAIALVFMLLNQRRNADLLMIGPTQKISETAFEQAKGIIEADGFLAARFHVQDHRKTIRCRVTNARLMVRTFGMDVLTGAKPIFALLDEIHILGSVPYAADVVRQIRGGMLPFPESLFFMITTQSDHQPQGVFKSELHYARAVRDGAVKGGRLLPVLYEFPEAIQTSRDQDWRNPALWHMVTPSLNKPITIERLQEGYDRALADSKEELIAWATQHLNVEVGLALHSNRWMGADYWEAAAEPGLTLDAILDRAEVVTMGIDGGGLDDLFGLAVIGRDRETKRWMAWAHAWAHPDVLERRKEIAGILRDFAKVGDLTLCERPTQDIEDVANLVQRIAGLGLLPDQQAVGLDPYGVAALIDEMAGRGVSDEQMAAIRQGSALSPAIWGLERKLKDGTFVHCGQPLMNWVLGNAVAEQRANAILITKQTAGKAKIDPLIAVLNAAMLMSRNPGAVWGMTPWDADPGYRMAV